jgi:hypothetical protein
LSLSLPPRTANRLRTSLSRFLGCRVAAISSIQCGAKFRLKHSSLTVCRQLAPGRLPRGEGKWPMAGCRRGSECAAPGGQLVANLRSQMTSWDCPDSRCLVERSAAGEDHWRPKGSELSRHSLRPIASGQHLSAIAKHDQSPGKLLDAGSID